MFSVRGFIKDMRKKGVNDFLTREEYDAEKNIAVFRSVLYALIFLEIFGVRFLLHESVSNLLLGILGGVFVFSILMMLDLIFIERLPWAKSLMPYVKYLVTLVDVLIICVLSYFIAIIFANTNNLEWVFSLIFLGSASLLLGVSLFRHHTETTLLTGILELVGFVVMKIVIFHYSGIIAIFNANHIYQLQNAVVIWILLTLVVLFALMAGRVRALVGRNKLQEELNRFLPENVTHQVEQGNVDIHLGGEKQWITVLFSDIRNFTTFSEKRSPEEVIDFLNGYFNDMIESVFHYHGTLDKLLGDGLMAFFGIPADGEIQQDQAVKCALDMLRRLESFNQLRKMKGEETIEIGIGIHTGLAIVGNVGSFRRMEYTAIGDTVNAASRIEDLTKKYKVPILISAETKKRLKGNFQAELVGKDHVKGKSEEVEIYKVVG